MSGTDVNFFPDLKIRFFKGLPSCLSSLNTLIDTLGGSLKTAEVT